MLGLIASLRSTASDPAALICSAVTGLPLRRVADGDRSELASQILEIGRQRQDRHHLAGRGDVEPRLGRHAVLAATETGDDAAQRAVGDVDRPAPGHGLNRGFVTVEDVRVDQRGEQVVRCRDRVEVAGEVEVDVLHRDDLRVPTAGGAALDPEDRTERRLA